MGSDRVLHLSGPSEISRPRNSSRTLIRILKVACSGIGNCSFSTRKAAGPQLYDSARYIELWFFYTLSAGPPHNREDLGNLFSLNCLGLAIIYSLKSFFFNVNFNSQYSLFHRKTTNP